MKLTNILLRWKKRPPGGHLWHGKHKLYKEVTPLAVALKRVQFEREEQNMFYLRHPYLTLEQSSGHAKYFEHRKKFIEEKKEKKLKWKDHCLLGDRFGFLKVTDRWE